MAVAVGYAAIDCAACSRCDRRAGECGVLDRGRTGCAGAECTDQRAAASAAASHADAIVAQCVYRSTL
jgi:hypothetical protein